MSNHIYRPTNERKNKSGKNCNLLGGGNEQMMCCYRVCDIG